MLLFNGLTKNTDLFAKVNASSLARTGYMIKDGGPSHAYSRSGEMAAYNSIGLLMRTPLSRGVYVRSRGESTLSASLSWQANQPWTAWALANWNLAFGMDELLGIAAEQQAEEG